MFGCERKRPLYCLSQQAQLEGLWAVELMPPSHHNSQDPSKNSSLTSCGPLHWVWTPVGDLSWGADTRLPPGAPPSGACQLPCPSQASPSELKCRPVHGWGTPNLSSTTFVCSLQNLFQFRKTETHVSFSSPSTYRLSLQDMWSSDAYHPAYQWPYLKGKDEGKGFSMSWGCWGPAPCWTGCLASGQLTDERTWLWRLSQTLASVIDETDLDLTSETPAEGRDSTVSAWGMWDSACPRHRHLLPRAQPFPTASGQLPLAW